MTYTFCTCADNLFHVLHVNCIHRFGLNFVLGFLTTWQSNFLGRSEGGGWVVKSLGQSEVPPFLRGSSLGLLQCKCDSATCRPGKIKHNYILN